MSKQGTSGMTIHSHRDCLQIACQISEKQSCDWMPKSKSPIVIFQSACLISKKMFQLTLVLSFSGETTIREILKCDKSDEITRRGKGPKRSMLDGGISFCNATESHSVQPLYIAPAHSRQSHYESSGGKDNSGSQLSRKEI